MTPHGLSGTARLGPSGTEHSDYREPESASVPQKRWHSDALNNANRESSGFLLTDQQRQAPHAHAPHSLTTDGLSSDRQLTHVTLVWLKGRREDWLKFGKPVASHIIDRRCRQESYAAGQIFALACWAANEYGTTRSCLYIVRAACAGEQVIPVPQVDPGGDLLLSVHGWPKVATVYRLIDAIEASGIDPCEVAPDHWRHIHNRIAAREAPRGYSPARHRAWLQRKRLSS
jgi:Protein of unknown function (DUF2840)